MSALTIFILSYFSLYLITVPGRGSISVVRFFFQDWLDRLVISAVNSVVIAATGWYVQEEITPDELPEHPWTTTETWPEPPVPEPIKDESDQSME